MKQICEGDKTNNDVFVDCPAVEGVKHALMAYSSRCTFHCYLIYLIGLSYTRRACTRYLTLT